MGFGVGAIVLVRTVIEALGTVGGSGLYSNLNLPCFTLFALGLLMTVYGGFKVYSFVKTGKHREGNRDDALRLTS